MENPIKQICRFNEEAGLLAKPYDDFLESSFQIEEALEGFNSLEYLGKLLTRDDAYCGTSPKELSRMIVDAALDKELSGYEDITDVDRLDKACDAVVFAVGSMAKLGLTATQITRALNIVMTANFKKLKGKTCDEYGKLMKPDSFVHPQEELQKLLDARKVQ